MLIDINENNEHYFEDQLVFQQNETPPYYTVQQYLNKIFLGQWIGRRGSVK